jgi:hypothetical protein
MRHLFNQARLARSWAADVALGFERQEGVDGPYAAQLPTTNTAAHRRRRRRDHCPWAGGVGRVDAP